MKVLLMLLGVPLLEILVFVQVGGKIGALWTVLLTVSTALFGLILVKTQGIRTLSHVREQLSQGQLPAAAVIEGIILLVSGAMLLTPGFVTDSIGLLGLLPFIRKAIAESVLKGMIVRQTAGGFSANVQSHNHTIEGQFDREK